MSGTLCRTYTTTGGGSESEINVTRLKLIELIYSFVFQPNVPTFPKTIFTNYIKSAATHCSRKSET